MEHQCCQLVRFSSCAFGAPCATNKNACRSAISVLGFSYITSPIRRRVCTGTEAGSIKFEALQKIRRGKPQNCLKEKIRLLQVGVNLFSKILTVRHTENIHIFCRMLWFAVINKKFFNAYQ